MTTHAVELSSFFAQTDLDAAAYEQFADAAHASFIARERFESLAREYQQRIEAGEGDPLRLALGLLILGKVSEALEVFKKAPPSGERHYYAAQAAAALADWDAAREELTQAARAGWDPFEVDMAKAVIHVRAGELNAAEKLIRGHEHDGQDRAPWYFATGLLAEWRGEREEALESQEKCLTLDPDHTEAMFCSARLYDRFGDDEQAIELYDRLALQPRAFVNALLNAAVVYEDIGKYDEAAICLRRVLKAHPNHTRARLFYKDVESCLEMVIDEVGEERVDARSRLLDTPLSEYELSVRARNCLKKMNIRTVGELMQLTEAELLAYKNFGETSLNEIKALLSKKQLRLGMRPEEIDVESIETQAPAPKVVTVAPGQEAILSRPVSDLELSVRARRCLQRLNIQTLRDLCQCSEPDLLAARNFGVTSLNEIKARLIEHGLQLAPKQA